MAGVAAAYGLPGMGLDAMGASMAGAMGAGVAGASSMSTAGMKQGTVKVWFEDKGFGFIAKAEGGDDVFVHRNTLQDGQTLVQGATVSYTAEWAPQRNKFAVTQCLGAAPGSGRPGTPPGATAPAAAAPSAGSTTAVSGTGTVKVWFDEKGFGFITPSTGGSDIFVHRNALQDGQMLNQGSQVTFSAEFSVQKNKMAVTQCTGATDRAPMAGMGTAAAGSLMAGLGSADNRFSPYPGAAVGGVQQVPMGYGAL